MARASVLALAAALAGALAGCGTIGATPDNLIAKIEQNKNSDSIQKYEVNRSLSAVTATLKEQSKHCLAVAVTMESPEFVSTRIYTPHVLAGGNHTRLALQQRVKVGNSDAYAEGEPRPDGWYVMVVDARAAGPHKTRIEAYSGLSDAAPLRAVRQWTEGSGLGCPDMTQQQ